MNSLSLAGVMVEPSRRTIALNEEFSLISEMRGGRVVVIGGPLTVKFDEDHLDEGIGCLKSYKGWRSMSGGSRKVIGSFRA